MPVQIEMQPPSRTSSPNVDNAGPRNTSTPTTPPRAALRARDIARHCGIDMEIRCRGDLCINLVDAPNSAWAVAEWSVRHPTALASVLVPAVLQVPADATACGHAIEDEASDDLLFLSKVEAGGGYLYECMMSHPRAAEMTIDERLGMIREGLAFCNDLADVEEVFGLSAGTTGVLVAGADLPAGHVITAGDLVVREVPLGAARCLVVCLLQPAPLSFGPSQHGVAIGPRPPTGKCAD